MSDLNSSSVLEITARRLPARLQRKWVKISSRTEDEGLEVGFDDVPRLVTDGVNQAVSKFASILHPTPGIEKSESETQSLMKKKSQRSGYRENSMMSSDPYKLSECKTFRRTSLTDGLKVARQTRLCLQEVHTKKNCEEMAKISAKLNMKSALSSSDPTSFQGITSQSKGVKLGICDNGDDSAHLSLADHDKMSGMPTTAGLNKGSVRLERKVELKAGAGTEGTDTGETVSVNDHRVAHVSTDVKVELELIIEDSSGGDLTVRQPSKGRTTTDPDASLSSPTGIRQSSLVLSPTKKVTSMNSRLLCSDYASIGQF
ncbi:unnamed protein product [Trichobilharzia regenti]|nr:unnamed protein product [Trichobilharzia regenti]